MPRKNDRQKYDPKYAVVRQEEPLSRIGVRRVEIENKRQVEIYPASFLVRTLARQLADIWVTLAASKSGTVVFVRRQAIISFLSYVDENATSDLDIIADEDEIARYFLRWFRTLAEQYTATSVMPSRLASHVQGTLFAAAQMAGLESGLLVSVASGPTPVRKPEANEIPEFSPKERSQLVKAARGHIRAFEKGRRWATSVLDGSAHLVGEPGSDVEEFIRRAVALSLSARDVDVASYIANPSRARAYFPTESQALRPGGLIRLTYDVVHPSALVLFSYRILLMEATALSADEITSLQMDRIEFDEESVTMHVVKARASRSRTVQFTARSQERPWSTPGILRRLIHATSGLREMSADAESRELWLTYQESAEGAVVKRCRFNTHATRLRAWMSRIEALGAPLELSEPLDIRRIRKGKVSERAVALGGRMADLTRDDHTVAVFNKYYAHSRTIQVYSAQRVVESQESLVELAKSGMVVFTDPPADLSVEELASAADVDEETALAIKDGELDVGMATCRDPHKSPFTKIGLLCSAAPLFCLACTNALVFPSHIPAIRDFIRRVGQERERMAPDEWIATFGQQIASAERILDEFEGELRDLPAEAEQAPTGCDLPMWVAGWNDEQFA